MAPNLNTPFHTSRLAVVPTAKVTYTLSQQAEVIAAASDKLMMIASKNGLTPLWRPTDGTEYDYEFSLVTVERSLPINNEKFNPFSVSVNPAQCFLS